MEIRGSVAIVTGSSRGIGRATASMLANAGSKVVLNGRKKTEALLAVADALGPPSRIHVAPGDVGDFETCRGIVRSATDRFGRVDILVNNAGIFGLRPMVERRRGVIVNIASFVAVRPPGPGRVHYAAAKSALLGLTRALGLEVAGTGVRVAGVAPGLTDTEIVRQGLPNLSERVARVPLGRMATADEVAHAVRFVVENEFMTAETVFVSGGE